MIIVYFETDNWHTEEVARFADDETYMACLPALEALAEKARMVVTESVLEEETLS
jgi:hypothetical protein